MAHFARVVDGSVLKIHVVNNDVITDGDGVEQESLGQQFLASVHGYPEAELIQCSYNGSFRKNYPGSGYTYDTSLDAFIPPKPHESWVLDQATCQWEAPVSYPDDGENYNWDEFSGVWVAD